MDGDGTPARRTRRPGTGCRAAWRETSPTARGRRRGHWASTYVGKARLALGCPGQHVGAASLGRPASWVTPRPCFRHRPARARRRPRGGGEAFAVAGALERLVFVDLAGIEGAGGEGGSQGGGGEGGEGGTSSSMYSRKWLQNSSNCRSKMPCTHLGMSSSTSPARAIFSSCASEARRLAIKASSMPPGWSK